MLKVPFKIIFFCAICGFGAGELIRAANIELSSLGKTDYVIARGKAPTQPELTAVKELAIHLQAVAGAEFEIQSEDALAPGQKAIYVGKTSYATTRQINFDSLGQEEWIIRTTDDGNLVLCGGHPRGTLYAVYEFLETQAGCRWLDETNDIIPKSPSLTIQPLSLRGSPCFRNRQIFDMLDWYPVSQTFKVRNKGTCYVGEEYGWSFKIGSPRQHHTFADYSASWPKDNLDLFSLNTKGERLIAKDGVGPGQICMTNPEVRRRVAEQLRSYIAQDRKDAAAGGYPAPTVYDISQNDNEDFCQCPECLKLIEREGSASGALLDFINDIAENIKPDYPEIHIRTFAYGFSRFPPKAIRPADNVIIHLAMLGMEFGRNGQRDVLRNLTRPENKSCREMLEKWSENAKNLAIWDYWVIYPPSPEPYVKISSIQPNLLFYKDHHVVDVFNECEGPHCTSFFGLKRYLGYKLMQNPKQPVEPLIEEFMTGLYGKAAPTMTELLHYMEKRQDENEGQSNSLDVRSREYLDLSYFIETLKLLDRAEELAAGDEKRLANIRRERVPVLGGLLMRWSQLAGVEKAFDAPARLEEFRRESLTAIDYYFPAPDSKTFRKEKLENLDKALKSFKLRLTTVDIPAKFRKPGVVDLPWFDFKTDIGKAKIVDDPQALGGKAIALGQDSPDRTQNGCTDFGIYDWNKNEMVRAKSFATDKLPKDEKYHLLKLGILDYRKHPFTYLYAGSNWQMQCHWYRRLKPKTYQLYLSIKFQGPDYVPGSKKENAMMVERLLLVPCEQ